MMRVVRGRRLLVLQHFALSGHQVHAQRDVGKLLVSTLGLGEGFSIRGFARTVNE